MSTEAQKLADSWKDLELTEMQRGIILSMGFKGQKLGGKWFIQAYGEEHITPLVNQGLVKYDKELDEYYMTEEVAEAVKIRFEGAEPSNKMFHSKL